jgi:flagellar basal body rod protein FlgB
VTIEENMMKVAKNAADYQMSTSLYKKIGDISKIAIGQSSGGS